MEPKKFLDSFFLKKIKKKDLASIKKKNLISDGLIDSLDIVTLSFLIKKNYKINISLNSEKTLKIFSSYNLLLKLLKNETKK